MRQIPEFPTNCPNCGRANELHADADGTDLTPKPGDFSLCFLCNEPAVYTVIEGSDVLGLRKPTEEELDSVAILVRELQAARREVYTPNELFDLLSESGWSSER